MNTWQFILLMCASPCSFIGLVILLSIVICGPVAIVCHCITDIKDNRERIIREYQESQK